MKYLLTAALAALAFSGPARAGPAEEELRQQQRDWEVIRYQTPPSGRARRFEQLSERAHRLAESGPGRADLLAWEGQVLSSWADAQGGWQALGLARRAKALFEAALRIDASTLEGAACDGLARLYARSLPWPLGFADKARARALLEQALSIDPAGLDTNASYGEFLVEAGELAQARPYLERALAATPRHGHYVADIGRREEVRALLERVRPAAP